METAIYIYIGLYKDYLSHSLNSSKFLKKDYIGDYFYYKRILSQRGYEEFRLWLI